MPPLAKIANNAAIRFAPMLRRKSDEGTADMMKYLTVDCETDDSRQRNGRQSQVSVKQAETDVAQGVWSALHDLPRRRRGERASPHKMRNFRSGLETLSDFEMEFTSNARQYRGVRVDVVLGEEISTVERVVDIKISANTLALRIGPDFYQGVRR